MATQICLHNSSIDYLKRWATVLTETDVYNTNGSLKSHTAIHPHGYFQVNADFTYNLFSDDEPVNGKWGINDSCQFVLNPGSTAERRFSVIALSPDSLTIRQKVARTVTTLHYASFTCPDLGNLSFRWDNAYTVTASYKTNPPILMKEYATGYLRLNPNASYTVFSGGVAMPLSGTWGISQPGCLLVLDKNKPFEKSYDVQRLTTDTLVIWRKDTVAKMNFLQYYSKHK